MKSKKRCWGKLLFFAVVFVMALVLAGGVKQVQAEICTEHVYDYSCDTRCNVCGEFRAVDHSYDIRKMDATYHWMECDCGKLSSVFSHWYVSDNETTCPDCGYVRELKHEFDAMGYDELYHWQECDCGAKTEKELHMYVDGKCKLCGNQKPDWYDESAHRIKNGVEYVSLKEAASYYKGQLMNRKKMGIELYYYIDSDKIYLNEMTALFEEMSQHTGVPTEGDLMWNLWNGGGYTEEIRDGETHYYSITGWAPDYGTTLEQEQKLSEEIDRILTELNIDTMTDYEKICAIYQYICDNVSYSHESLTYSSDADTQMVASAYGALMNGYAVCDGYADLVYRMMLEAGIDTRVISSFSHAWNIVELDGVYYCVDATNDAGKNVEDYQFFLCGLAELRGRSADHSENMEFHTLEFFEQYPVSYVSYGKSLPETDGVVQSGSCGNLTWTLTGTGVFTITGTGEMDFSTWWDWKGFIKKVVIGEGITSISDDAFSNCCALEEVVIPNTVTKIGSRAFRYCDRLKSITLPENVTSLGNHVFWGCGSLKEVILPDSVTSLGEGAFRGCFSLERVVFSKGIRIMEKETFLECAALRTVILPDGLKEICEYAFAECVSLEELLLPSTLEKLGEYVFENAFSYKAEVSITLPESVTEVGSRCFKTSNLSEIIWNASAERIEEETFEECRYLKNVVLGNAVKQIGKDAFNYCLSLKTAILSENLVEVEERAFCRCESLQEITIPGSLKRIGDSMFSGCESLAMIEFQEGTEIIGNRAFQECNSLITVTIPAGIKELGEAAFSWCEGLKKVIFEGEPPKVTQEGTVPFQNGHFTAYYWSNKGTWTRDKMNSLTNAGSVTWVAMHDENGEHTKATQWSMDIFGHWHSCTGCAKEYDRQDHVFDSEADMSCNICGYCKVTKGEHFCYIREFDESSHWYECECGERGNVEKHMYESETSTNCWACGYVRTIPQITEVPEKPQITEVPEEPTWSYDEISHWTQYANGDYVSAGHDYSTDRDDTCNVCGYVRVIPHEHNFLSKYDEENHYQECECGERNNVQPHAFKYDCSEKCQYCRYKRSDIEHNYKIQRNEKKHWLECECGVKEQIEDHAWRVSQELEYAIIYFCDFCKADKRESIPKATETPQATDAPTPTSAPAEAVSITGETGGNNMVIIISAVVAVVLLGGIGIGIAVKKKRG